MANLQYLSLPANAAGLTPSSSATAWNYGSYVEATASTSTGIYITGIEFSPTSGNNPATADTTYESLFEIATGAGGAESVKIQVPQSYRADTITSASNGLGYYHFGPNVVYFPEPYFVPIGTRVAVRVTDSIASAIQYRVKLRYKEGQPPTVSLSTPADAATITDTTPDLVFTGTDTERDDVRYNIEVDTATFSDITLGNTTTRNSTTSPDSWAFDSGTGSNRIMIVGFSNFDTTAGDRQVSSITYGGEALTRVTGAVADNATSSGRGELWYRIAPLTGSNTLAVTYGGAPTNSDYFVAIFNNVHQSSPIDDSDFGTTTGGTSDTITLTTTVSDCMLVDVNNGDAGPMSIGTGQTSLMNSSGSTGRGSYKLVQTPGNYTMTVSTSANDNYAHGAIALKPVARLIDKVSGTDAGFSGSPDNTDPFTSGQAVTYTVQSALTDLTTYYWRVRAIDPTGSNSYGSWSSTRSFYLNTSPVSSSQQSMTMLGIGS